MSELDGDYAENQYCPIHLPLVAALSLKKEHKQDAEIKMECEEEKKGKNLLIGNITGGTVGLCVKRSPLPKVTPVRFPIGATRVFQTIRFSSLREKSNTSLLGLVLESN